jgi:hypothetical protein
MSAGAVVKVAFPAALVKVAFLMSVIVEVTPSVLVKVAFRVDVADAVGAGEEAAPVGTASFPPAAVLVAFADEVGVMAVTEAVLVSVAVDDDEELTALLAERQPRS